MIEYLYDAIRVSAETGFSMGAQIKDDDGELITSGCDLKIYDDENMIVRVDGMFDGTAWNFHVSPDAVKGLKGRFWYCVTHNDMDISFKQPIYFM